LRKVLESSEQLVEIARHGAGNATTSSAAKLRHNKSDMRHKASFRTGRELKIDYGMSYCSGGYL